MDAGSIDLAGAWRPAVGSVGARLSLWVSYLAVAALALSAAVIAARRFASALQEPLSPLAIGAAVTLAALLAATARFAAPASQDASQRAALVLRWLPGLLLIIFVAALSLPGTSLAALAVAWGIVVAEETLVWRRCRPSARRRNRITTRHAEPNSTTVAGEPDPAFAISRVESEFPQPSPIAPLLPPPNAALSAEVSQQSTRSRTAGGIDRLAGWLQMPLATGERNATAHIAFCPPFLETPKISLRQTAGPAGRVRAVQILPHGVRLELKLDHPPRQPQRVSVEFLAEGRAG